MKRRLRKKKRLGEFREFGFEVVARFVPGTTEEHWTSLFEASEAISHNGPNGSGLCACMGGGPHGAFVTVTYCPWGHRDRRRHRNCGSTTEEHRRLVEDFLRGRSEVAEFLVGPMVDVWHGKLRPEVRVEVKDQKLEDFLIFA